MVFLLFMRFNSVLDTAYVGVINMWVRGLTDNIRCVMCGKEYPFINHCLV